MLQNSMLTAGIVSEFLRENQQGVKLPSPHTQIQLMIAINFMASKDNEEERVMHSKSDNIEIMINDKADEVTEELF